MRAREVVEYVLQHSIQLVDRFTDVLEVSQYFWNVVFVFTADIRRQVAQIVIPISVTVVV